MDRKSKINEIKIAEHFMLKEFASHDTGEVMLDARLLDLLEIIRIRINEPLIITSGYRTLEWNRKVKGVFNSYHRLGMAADITAKKVSLIKLAFTCARSFVPGMVVYEKENFIHIEMKSHAKYSIPESWTNEWNELLRLGE